MNPLKLLSIILLITIQKSFAQQAANNKSAINDIINQYRESVIEKDSVKFYNLFNDGPVIWCAAVKDRSHAKEIERDGIKATGSNYFAGSYKGFLRGLFKYQLTEDKFDNIQIIEDGTVASATMDYSFWANNKMTNWGSKYLGLIKRDGKWKITSVIYSLELTEYFKQPTLKERMKSRLGSKS
ncbi:nuclear transport factor 2 family protein [Pedobacter miscanthi]|uniref:nuclear transport factor 2 family protein n=1 Tax=Pedobacter miscanthi TaxID=2259170 RepID=UPI0029304923|nr:nuclear transport factor 2 family protein [Pedobacter miscanthi]